MTPVLSPGVERALDRLVGLPRRVEHLRGVGAAGAYLCAGPAGRVVVKEPVEDRERAFYHRVAPRLSPWGVRAARMLASGGGWLVLEELPAAPDVTALGVGQPALQQLATLHRVRPDVVTSTGLVPKRFAWTAAMSRQACSALGPSVAPDVAVLLPALRREAAHLLRPVGVVHGDPNPTNWRLDGAGMPVLVDWARLGLGHPALDVAIFLPGLPDRAVAASAAASYLALRPDLRAGVAERFAHAIRVAKLWSCVEFLAAAGSAPGHGGVQASVAMLRERLLAWLGTVRPA